MLKHIEHRVVVEKINILKDANEYSVTNLAKVLEVSRAYLYKYFGELLIQNEVKSSKGKIKNAIKVLRSRTGRKKLTQTEVAKEAGLSRQSLSRDYKHLHQYISGDLDFEDASLPPNASLEHQIRTLTDENNRLIEKNFSDLEQQKKILISTLMLQDLKSFSAQETDLSLNKLQSQNDELKYQNRIQLNELASLKADINDFKHKLSGSVTTDVRAHFKADYSSIDKSLNDKEIFKLFIDAENKNIGIAIEACITSQPESILFFQPFLTCNIHNVPIHLYSKRLVIIESNIFLSSNYKEITENFPNIPIHAVCATNMKLYTARVHCRSAFGSNMFSDNFLNNLFEKIHTPLLEDGFASVTLFTPEKLLSVVK